MIHSLEIINCERVPRFSGKVFEFKPGVNILVGKNGSGKSTLLDAIKKVCLCDQAYYTRVPPFALWQWKEDLKNTRLVADYETPVINTYEMNSIDLEAKNSLVDFGIFCSQKNRMSKGEYQMESLMNGLEYAVTGKFSKDIMPKTFEDCLDERFLETWKKYLLENPTIKNTEVITRTLISDEPDSGLDASNILDLANVMSNIVKRDEFQFICSLHNMALISLFRKSNLKVNWIDLDGDYLSKIDYVYEYIKNYDNNNKTRKKSSRSTVSKL